MKNTLILLSLIFAFNLNAQDLKSLSKSVDEVSETKEKTSLIEKLATDQVQKLTKKLNLSEKQQTLVSDLVVSQLKTQKFQKLINSFSPSQLMGGKAQSKIAESLMGSKSFTSGLDKVLTKDQKKIN